MGTHTKNKGVKEPQGNPRPAPVAPSPEGEEDFRKKLDGLSAQNAELTALVKRVQADFENYKKRADDERRAACQQATAELLRRLLTLVDSFDHALAQESKTSSVTQGTGKVTQTAPPPKSAVVDGLRMIHAQFMDILRKEGVQPISTTGERFDPTLHEVLFKEHSPQPRNVIIAELQKGYYCHEKILRHSKVAISSGPAEPAVATTAAAEAVTLVEKETKEEEKEA